ncbi:MAG: glycosyltransferase family 2 protein [Bacteroidales bacterium]|jgi:glycosyltransferase involved in cell wall biosynthesis
MTTAITVCYNTPALIATAVQSIKMFYPDMKIIIIDGSPMFSECYQKVEELQQKYPKIVIRHMLRNIGHGAGLQIGVKETKSDNILFFDSDIKLKDGCIAEMRSLLTPGVLGCGYVCRVNSDGYNTPGGMRYLHPYFALIKRSEYLKCSPARNHGAPLIDTMKSAKKNKMKVLDFDLSKYVEHKWRGTRNINPKWMEQL